MKKHFTIVGFGDSITEAKTGTASEDEKWLNILKIKLCGEFKDHSFNVINSGVGGNSTREAMSRFDKDVLAHDPDFVLLEFGGNNNDPGRPERRVGFDEFKMLLAKYKNSISAKCRTLVITFPPVFKDQHIYGKNPDSLKYYDTCGGIEADIEAYREITREFANENNFPLFDLYAKLIELGQKHSRGKYTLNDGVHLTPEGNKVLAEYIYDILRSLISSAE